jgi:hypothetical protein
MGTDHDMKRRETLKRSDTKEHRSIIERARDWIFRLGYGVGSVAVEGLLSAKSWVPTCVGSFQVVPGEQLLTTFQNTFSKLAPLGFDYYKMLVVDLLHDVLLGIWKTLFTHLIRILHSRPAAAAATEQMDER